MDKAVFFVLSMVILNADPIDGGVEDFRAVCRSDTSPLSGVYSNTKNDVLYCARMCLESEACNYFATRRQTGDCSLGFGITPCGWNTATSAGAKWTTYMKAGHIQVCNCSTDMIQFGSSCYIFPSGTYTWHQGFDLCASLNTSMVEIEDLSENAFLGIEGKARGYVRIWLGGTDSAVEGTWVWNSGAPVTMNNWSPPEPNNNGNEDWIEMVVGHLGWNDNRITAMDHMACEVSCFQ